jgi:hypothetical protein
MPGGGGSGLDSKAVREEVHRLSMSASGLGGVDGREPIIPNTQVIAMHNVYAAPQNAGLRPPTPLFASLFISVCVYVKSHNKLVELNN